VGLYEGRDCGIIGVSITVEDLKRVLSRSSSIYITYPLGFRIWDSEDSRESLRG
jgi:hypothetical protein